MMRVFVVIDASHPYGGILEVIGVYSTIEKALEMVNLKPYHYDYDAFDLDVKPTVEGV